MLYRDIYQNQIVYHDNISIRFNSGACDRYEMTSSACLTQLVTEEVASPVFTASDHKRKKNNP